MGGSGGGGGHTPYEAPETGRSKQAVKIVEIISEGEIKGLIHGVQSVFLDNTPIQNKDGTWNFSNVEAEGRIGIQDQDILEGFNTSEKEVSVGTQVRKNTPLTRTVSDTKVSRLRLTLGVQSLFQQNDQGDTHGASVTLNIFIGARVIPLTISGKYSSQYLRQIEVDNLPPAPFTVRVERVEADSTSQRLQNNTIWASYTEIIETQLAYPNTALVGIKFDSDYFSAIPNRTYEVYGIIVQVPSNYDPQTRTYIGIWDGTFKAAWSDNPAWVLYDLLKNKRYGFGRRIGDFAVDKWALYNVAKYCDRLVDDGFGGKEPRFTCNAWITEQRQAYDVINDICSIFRAIPVWNGREFTVIQDRPSDPVWTYTNANVEKGEFTYSYSAMKARHNEIHVEYANAQNNYEKDVICVSDDDLIRRYGLNVKKVTAFGCTSRGQAYRTGRWILETEKLETRTVTFTVGAEGLMHVPGDIILVADNDYAGTQIGGRVLSVEQNTVTIDRETQFKAGDKFMFYNQAAEVVSVKVAEVLTGNKLRLEVPPTGLTEYGVWLRHGDKIQPQLYRALSIKEDRNGKYTITAIQHEPQKEAIVDSGAHFEPVSFSETPERYRIQNVDVAVTDGGVKLTFDYFAKNESTVKYQVKLYRTFGGKTSLYKVYDDLTTTSITFAGLPNGSYTAEIRAKNGVGQLSDPVTRTFEINLDIKRFVTKSLLFAIELDWDLPKTAAVGNYTEVWRSTTNDISKAVKVATLPYPQNNYIMSGVSLNDQYYFWLRCGDKNDNKGEFTAAVFGEADHNPDNLLNAIEGKITKSHLGQELINSLKNDVDSAVSEEAKARIAAVNNALQQINNQAATAGTAIQKLEKADKDQAETIKTVTAKAESALSGITAVRQAQANSDKANAQQISALTTRVINAEGAITQAQVAISSNNQSTVEQINQINAKFTPINQKLDGKLDGLVKTTLDLTRLDQNKWYPVTFDRIPTVGRSNLIVRQDLYQGLHSPVWATHGSKSFSLLCDWIVNGSGWGTIEVDRQVNVFEYGFTQDNKSPILNLGQLTQSSMEYCCLRGGAKYDVFAPKGISVELRTSDYTKNIAGYTQTVNVVNNYDVALVPKSELKSLNANISVVSRAVADVSGKLSATHTIKTQVIGGGRTAIAGIALGASSDGKTTESSVIVMADKFGIVANANDSNVKQVFSVANGQVGIRGDLVVAGSVTRDKLSSGGGGNLFYNPIFANPTDGVPHGWTKFERAIPIDKIGERRCFQDPDYGLKKGGYLPNENVLRWHNRPIGDTKSLTGIYQNVPVSANKWYIVSAYMGNHNCSNVELYVDVRTNDGGWGQNLTRSIPKNKNFVGINDAERAFVKFKMPPNGVSVDVFLFMHDADGSNPNGCWMFVGRPMLEECTEHTTEPSPWQNAGLTEVHGGSIIANTIRGDHIQANQEIRAPRISGGEIDISGNDGILRVGRTGNFLVRASSQDRGLVMNNDQIIVYDERGNVRVKIGKLM